MRAFSIQVKRRAVIVSGRSLLLLQLTACHSNLDRWSRNTPRALHIAVAPYAKVQTQWFRISNRESRSGFQHTDSSLITIMLSHRVQESSIVLYVQAESRLKSDTVGALQAKMRWTDYESVRLDSIRATPKSGLFVTLNDSGALEGAVQFNAFRSVGSDDEIQSLLQIYLSSRKPNFCTTVDLELDIVGSIDGRKIPLGASRISRQVCAQPSRNR